MQATGKPVNTGHPTPPDPLWPGWSRRSGVRVPSLTLGGFSIVRERARQHGATMLRSMAATGNERAAVRDTAWDGYAPSVAESVRGCG